MAWVAQAPSEERLRALLRQGTIGNAFVPVLCGSAFKNKASASSGVFAQYETWKAFC